MMRLPSWLAWRRRRDDDLQEEIASHLALAVQDRIAQGEDPRDARFAARKEFGNLTLTREATRRTWGGRWIDWTLDLLRDVRYALRLLVRSPGYSLVVIAVLALGIACNLVAFGLYKALALAPLAGVPDSGSLHYVGVRTTGGRLAPLSYPDYQYLRDRAYPNLAFWAIQPLVLGTGTDGQLAAAEFVSGNYFRTLGVHAQLGRTLLPSDEVAPGRHPVVVIADGLWHRAFGADPDIVGRTIELNGQPLTVIGVAARDFRGAIVGLATDLFVPVMMQPALAGSNGLDNRNNHWLHAFMRLPTGVTLAQTEAHAAVVSDELERQFPLGDTYERATIVPIWEWPYGAQTYILPAVAVMGAMSALLLIVVCANVAGLVLARGVGRRGEIAARLAVGASRGRILRQLTIESLALAIPGAACGFFLPGLAEPFLGAAASNVPLPLYFNVEPDRFVIAFTVALACIVAIVYGFGPALRLSRIDLASVMKDDLSPRGGAGGGLRTTLVVAQIAVSLLLLVGTGLMARTLDVARRADTGFDARQVTWATLDLRAGGHDERSGRAVFRQLIEEIESDSRVETASLAAYLPLTLVDWQSWHFVPEGYATRRDEDLAFALNVVTPGYFRTLRIPLAAGREFDWRDDDANDPVAIVNETFAHRFWGGPDAAIGKRIESGGNWLTVIGVARDITYARLDEAPRPYVYLPYQQLYRPDMTLHVRASADPASVLELIHARAVRVDATLPILDSGPLGDQMRSAVSLFETVARVLALIGVVAAGLAGLGVYGLVAYTVKQRAHEIGIRTAVGAAPGRIARRFTAAGVMLGLVGVLLGLLAAAALTRVMSATLYGVSTIDTVSFASAAVAVLAVVLVASFVPAWRAARIDPVAALRHR